MVLPMSSEEGVLVRWGLRQGNSRLRPVAILTGLPLIPMVALAVVVDLMLLPPITEGATTLQPHLLTVVADRAIRDILTQEEAAVYQRRQEVVVDQVFLHLAEALRVAEVVFQPPVEALLVEVVRLRVADRGRHQAHQAVAVVVPEEVVENSKIEEIQKNYITW